MSPKQIYWLYVTQDNYVMWWNGVIIDVRCGLQSDGDNFIKVKLEKDGATNKGISSRSQEMKGNNR